VTALAPELSTLVRSLLALVAVLALVVAARRLIPRTGIVRVAGEPLTLVASLALDTRNRIVVVRRGPAEFVLAVGPQGAVPLPPASAARTEAADTA
jgi:flagellar biogenesis protein FliO